MLEEVLAVRRGGLGITAIDGLPSGQDESMVTLHLDVEAALDAGYVALTITGPALQ